MTTATDAEIARAQTLGRLAARDELSLSATRTTKGGRSSAPDGRWPTQV